MTRKLKADRTVDVKSVARGLGKASLDTLKGIMGSPHSTDTARIACASILLDRGFGKPQQSVDIAAKLEFTEIIRKIVK